MYAEDLNYWDTTVSPSNSLGEVQELLEQFGCTSTSITTMKTVEDIGWVIRFEWQQRTYRFTFVPIECKDPARINSYGKQRRTHKEQARYQMGRIAAAFVKAVLTAASTQPAALFGFMEIPAKAGERTRTAAELELNDLRLAAPKQEVI